MRRAKTVTKFKIKPQSNIDGHPFRLLTSNFLESKTATIATVIMFGILLIAFFAPLISSQNPYDLAQITILDGTLAPGLKGHQGTTYWLGTDDQGRDMLSAILYGLRISLAIGLSSGFLALIFGTAIGLLAAYYGGKLDVLVMRIVDLQLSFPALLIALVLLAILGRGIDKVIFALVISQWAYFARTVRGTALVEKKKEYIEAANCLALSTKRIMFRHLLPNCMPPLIVIGAVNVANAIALEATLSFLGVGLPITEPSLGLLISNGYEYMLSGQYWISVFPGIALLVTVASINIFTERLREVLNPRLEK